MNVYKFTTGTGMCLVYADNPARAKTMVTDPDIVAAGMLTAELQAGIVGDGVLLGLNELFMVELMNMNVLTETKYMSVKTSAAAFRDESLKLFISHRENGDGRYIIAAKDRDDALTLINEIGAVDNLVDNDDIAEKTVFIKALTEQLAEQDTPRSEFEGVPKIISRGVIDWYKAKQAEPPMMPQPQYVM